MSSQQEEKEWHDVLQQIVDIEKQLINTKYIDHIKLQKLQIKIHQLLSNDNSNNIIPPEIQELLIKGQTKIAEWLMFITKEQLITEREEQPENNIVNETDYHIQYTQQNYDISCCKQMAFQVQCAIDENEKYQIFDQIETAVLWIISYAFDCVDIPDIENLTIHCSILNENADRLLQLLNIYKEYFTDDFVKIINYWIDQAQSNKSLCQMSLKHQQNCSQHCNMHTLGYQDYEQILDEQKKLLCAYYNDTVVETTQCQQGCDRSCPCHITNSCLLPK